MADTSRPNRTPGPVPQPDLRALRNYRIALGVSVGIVAVLLLMFVAGSVRPKRARMVAIDGQAICLVRDQVAARSVREAILKEGRGGLPGKATIAQRWEEVVVSTGDQRPVSPAEAVQLLTPRVTVLVESAVIVVEGVACAKLPSADLARQVLEAVKSLYVHDGERICSQDFREKVAIQTVATPPGEVISDVNKAVALVARSRREPESYAVKAGDVPDKIAAHHSMKLGELYALNPGLKGRDIRAGELLKVSTARPLLTVVTVKDVTRTEAFAAPPERVASANVTKGKEVIEKPGEPGERTVREQQTCENGRVVKRTVLQQSITRQPVAARIAYNPTAPPTAAKGH